ncbi:Inhibitor of nuclear factor kappa-B kinase-interacting protein [Bagarius yarrelli]|uniref:Inhibitor of nuclear factor kappa-B kinase-interacting protein n=1 Tax=Bagarius yarrelli TaxID=175774 RepID=A0A556TH81_BAGYA|nr:Inhibitor of nuclear factor kappa-B kinase-interacting protein [Bagarius yarrelli]
MPSDGVKLRKGKAADNGDTADPAQICAKEKVKRHEVAPEKHPQGFSVDIRTVVSLVSLSACLLLAWAILQQNARVNEVEEKYKSLYEKTADLLTLEKTFSAASKKLEASEDHLTGALSSLTTLTELQMDVDSLSDIVKAIQGDQHASSTRLNSVNDRFLNVTETWQGGLATVTEDLTSLRLESRSVHNRITEHVNQAEERLHALAKRLEELEDSTKRNGRVLERTEEEDARSAQNQLDWNTKQVARLQEQLVLLSKRDTEFEEKLVVMEPQAKECQAHLPAVEDAVRSILRLRADLSGAERRLEDLTLQVVGTEDSLLKALTEILQLQQTLDNLQVDNSVMKVRNELGVVLDAMKKLKRVQREEELDSGREESEEDEGKNCEDIQVQLTNQEVQVPLNQLNSIKEEVAQLKEWASGLTEHRQQLHVNLAHLTQAVEHIENRTTAISSDVTAKVASVRTDVRRMGGLEGDVEALLSQTSELEEKVAQAEKLMSKRIGELLANSISRVAGLRTSTEKNTKSLEQMRKRTSELAAADAKLGERILVLESGRAKLTRTVMFANDLRPKVSTIKRDFAILEPQLADLTLRIGHLAEDVMKREGDILQIKETLANFAAVKKELNQAKEDLAVKETTVVLQQNDLSPTLNHTEL